MAVDKEPPPKPISSPDRNINLLLARVDELRHRLQARHPSHLAEMTGAKYYSRGSDTGVFRLPVWGQEILLPYPELVATDTLSRKEAGMVVQALLLYYFMTADGTPESHKWISFSELPSGRFYTQAFQGYTGGELARYFKENRKAFELAAQQLAGEQEAVGDLAYRFNVFPHFSILVIYWQGDEDFPSNLQILFDASAPHYLPTDACAVAGSMLTRKLISSGS